MFEIMTSLAFADLNNWEMTYLLILVYSPLIAVIVFIIYAITALVKDLKNRKIRTSTKIFLVLMLVIPTYVIYRYAASYFQ